MGYITVISVTCLICAILFLLKEYALPEKGYRKLKITFVILLYLILAAGIFSPAFMEFNYSGTTNTNAIVSFDKQNKIKSITTGDGMVFCISNCSKVVTKFQIASSVKPITENPKVMPINYQIEVRINNLDLFFQTIGIKPMELFDIPSASINRRACEQKVQYFLNEFNYWHSKEMAKFYNPLDEKQNQELESLIKQEVNPHLKKYGINIEKLISFSIE